MFKLIACRFCWPSSRLIVIVNGLNPPAWILVVPAVNDGANGRLAPGHEVPFGPCSMLKDEDVFTGVLPSHGVNDARVVYVPHRDGVASGARSPPKKCSSRSSKGKSGVFLNVVMIWPGV
jgi:hypothetical protein